MKKLNKERLSEKIRTRVENDIAKSFVGAAEILVSQHGETLFHQRFGYAKEAGIYRLASMTKPITAVAALIAEERGLLHLEDVVEKYYPEYANLQIGVWNEQGELVETRPAVTKPTLFQLLTHTSGIGGSAQEVHYLDAMSPEEKENLQSAALYYWKVPLGFEPGTDQQYSPIAAFDLIAAIIEKVSGVSYDRFLQREILEPCQMMNTFFVPNQEQWPRLMPVHFFENGRSVQRNVVERCMFFNVPWSRYLGGGGLLSTAEDYFRFAEMVRNYGRIGEQQLVSEDRIRYMTTPRLEKTMTEPGESFGLAGRVVLKNHPEFPEGIYGWGGAYGANWMVDFQNGITAVYMKNSNIYEGAEFETFYHLEQDIYDSLE